MQEKVKLQQQERKRLSTQLAMEQSLEQDLSSQLRQLERELTQLHMRHAHNRAEIEGERRAVQILERDYASLTEQEQELQRDCEVFELQLDTERAQLREIRSQQLYLDFVSSAPLKRHMEEKKWQEQHAAVVLQVQNAEAENHALEGAIRKLEDEASNLEAQYALDIQTKQQSETSLAEIRANYERFQEAFERTRVCYTPRPDWDRIVDETPELSVQKYQWEMIDTASSRDVMASINSNMDEKDGVLEHRAIDLGDEEQRSNSRGQTKTLVREMLHWIERLQKHCGVNLHLSRLDRAVRKSSMLSIALPNMSGVITIAAATSPMGSPSKRRQDYINALGMHEGIPLFLRHRGKLKRRILKKLDVEKVVRKVWVEKRKREQRNPLGRFPLEQVLYEKLHRNWDSEIEMFLLCLTGAVSDLVLLDSCKRSEQTIIGDMHKMKRGGNDSILYIEDILPLDVKYPLGFFVKTIRTQHFKEIQDYYALLLSELEQRDTEMRGILPLSAVRDAILAIDPLADPSAVQNLLMKALHIKTRAQLHMRESVHYKAVLRKLNSTCLMKFALNFDQNAEVNWRRRPGAAYINSVTGNQQQDRKASQ
ncbi:Translin-associated factor X-interacting protein 1 [Phytophthora cinnamomi]|uniref:Translin-associated factor X-interacting protein 1 n=1 Tax=Phytophthora cinnamomi TaxID=4785 RepID=UPI00355AA23E|nr:Translin-associated factor X-interacting protein 1 [Phytophthora cinnamomi]